MTGMSQLGVLPLVATQAELGSHVQDPVRVIGTQFTVLARLHSDSKP